MISGVANKTSHRSSVSSPPSATEPPSSASSIPERRRDPDSLLAGFDLLALAVVVLDAQGVCYYLNDSAEQLFGVSPRSARGQTFSRLFVNGAVLDEILLAASQRRFDQLTQDLELERHGRPPVAVQSTAVILENGPGSLLLEFREIDKRLKADRDLRLHDSAQANRELVRNLAHEIKNPLGGIRGAAQLLEMELNDPALREYSQVIIKEADRLQVLVDRLLAPHRQARRVVAVNIHEVCERVRSVLLAEFSQGLRIERDYDASLPDFPGDREQLIQATLNLARNAAQALNGRGKIILRTRVAHRVLIAKRVVRLALDLHVIDDGPGIPEAIRDRIFFPLVSGREGGSGLGLSLAQTFVQQHGGVIECQSRPGFTDFRVLLPLG
jgi:two-component system nitrogen regulation sensor histidine kinase GlnL